MKTEMTTFYNNKIKVNEELILVNLNCTLLHDQNGWMEIMNGTERNATNAQIW
jgi:hypothetical protein